MRVGGCGGGVFRVLDMPFHGWMHCTMVQCALIGDGCGSGVEAFRRYNYWYLKNAQNNHAIFWVRKPNTHAERFKHWEKNICSLFLLQRSHFIVQGNVIIIKLCEK